LSRIYEGSLSKGLASYPCPTSLSFNFVAEPKALLYDIPLPQLNNVTSLTVQTCLDSTLHTRHFLLWLIRRLPNLQTLHVKTDIMNADTMKAISKLTKLVSLQYYVSKDWKEYLPDTIEYCSKSTTLTHLSLQSPSYGRYDPVSFTALADLGKSLSNLKSLELQGLWQGCDQILANMRCPNLAHIKVFQSFFSQHLDEQLVQFFGYHQRYLRSVSIQGNWRGCYTDWSDELLYLLRDIQELSFTSTDIFVNSNCAAISKYCCHLRQLEVRTYKSDEMEENTLSLLHARCPVLKSVTVKPLASISTKITEYSRQNHKFELNASNKL